MRLGKVDNVIMLGDMLDWGRGLMTENEYVLSLDELIVDTQVTIPSSVPSSNSLLLYRYISFLVIMISLLVPIATSLHMPEIDSPDTFLSLIQSSP